MEKSFSQVNEAFDTLKAKFQTGEISRQEFIDEMKKLRIRDDEGRFWMIGAQTGKWYYFDGKDWIQSEPPSQKDQDRHLRLLRFREQARRRRAAPAAAGRSARSRRNARTAARLSAGRS